MVVPFNSPPTIYKNVVMVGADMPDPPPLGRRNFFVAASSFGNVLFLTVILVSGIGTLAHVACRQS